MYDRSSNGRSRVKGSRVSRCGSKGGGGSSYDPQVGQAAMENAQNAAQAQKFSEDYFTNTVSPLLAAETAQSKQTTSDENQLFGLNMHQAQEASDRYDQYGIPAANNYYKMVAGYNSQQQQESQAQAAIGDMRTAEASNADTLSRQQRSLGINPTSGAALSMASDASTANTAAEAAAATRARYNAQQLGMQLTADAANFSNTGISALSSTTGSAGASTQGALGSAATALSGGNSAASVPMSGYSLASSAYGNNLDAYSRLGAADISASAQADSGFGQALGTLGAAYLQYGLPSDRRLKRNIERVGTWVRDLPVYEYQYLWSDQWYRGVMADEVEAVMPAAVMTSSAGYKMVNYDMLRAA